MQRLYFLTPDSRITCDIANELSDLGLQQDHIHVAARNHGQLKAMGLKKATLMQTTDTANAARRGVMIGIPLGLVIGGIAAMVLSLPSQTGNLALVVGMGVFGGLFGLWASTLIGVSVPDAKVKKYQSDIQRGAMLMMVDVADDQEGRVADIIRRHHPDVNVERVTREEQRHAEGQGH